VSLKRTRGAPVPGFEALGRCRTGPTGAVPGMVGCKSCCPKVASNLQEAGGLCSPLAAGESRMEIRVKREVTQHG
jgi:hypothetical protein